MSEQTVVTIEAQPRTGSGKSYTHKLRRAGKIPAVLLEAGKATSIELDPSFCQKLGSLVTVSSIWSWMAKRFPSKSKSCKLILSSVMPCMWI